MNKKQIDATQYRFESFHIGKLFGFLGLPAGVEEVEVIKLRDTSHGLNRVSFDVYGDGSVYQSAGMLLVDGRVLFCVISGSRFRGTFSSNENIQMAYYLMTKI